MKFKTLFVIALCSLFATTFCYAESDLQMADDSSGLTTMPPSATDSNQMGTPAPGQNTDTPAASGNLNEAPAPSNAANTGDDMSADTATGDDDY